MITKQMAPLQEMFDVCSFRERVRSKKKAGNFFNRKKKQKPQNTKKIRVLIRPEKTRKTQ